MVVSTTTTALGRTDRPSGLASFIFGGGVVHRLPGQWDGIASGLLVIPRIWLAVPFLAAGTTRLGNWGSQGFLFEHIHPVPFLDPGLAAVFTTAGETVLSVLLVLGLFGRFAALGLAVMAAVIYFVVGQTPEGVDNGIALATEQIPWIAVGLLLFVTGPGRLSLDHAIAVKLGGREAEVGTAPILCVLSALFLLVVALEKAAVWATPFGWLF